MKINKLLLLISLAVGLTFTACADMDNVLPESGTLLESQLQETNAIAPERAQAAFSGLFSDIGKPAKMYSTPDDWGFLMINFCNDLEGPDALIPDNNYNWFGVCGELSSRNANYRNPAIRYRTPYNMISDSNTFMKSVGETESQELIYMLAQARALRAYAYMTLAPAFQFNYQIAGDQPCVPILSPDTEDFANNPRATVKEVYAVIIEDLDYAINNLAGYSRKTKMYVNKDVAHGLRARAYLAMGEWQKAYDDAQTAAANYTPATREEVSKPSFMDITEHNWLWGYDMTTDMAMRYRYATTSSWLRSFSAWGYAPATQCYTLINTLLYNKIPDTDIRKQWWVDENLESTLLDGLKWPGYDDVAHADDGGDAKLPYLPYTNVKFGCLTIGTTSNDEDTPLMRVEEMILIQAECQARLGNEGAARDILSNFVKTYRDPQYSVAGRGLSLLDEIWFQRRVELWGEGFAVPDARRLNKPLVRFHDETNNMPAAFRFNLAANDPWLLMRFPQAEMNTNFGIVDNTGGQLPTTGEGRDLRDGVTD
ncbi:MAG TPA: RagB/SusD family nutrient uptake outer membrane protein [Bacteroidales bacterium]|jgi:hypothetical protein|nr:RagB/SusD family nutrient uptake outer membrane protein [Bacteroidales bacterium]HKM12149.1 RagB/SusD family nutrient uptake outer membrane protein [Bacteroidales bacterium]HPB89106.1 RagB/SusD family nutrient uptake outer membrane protein [Bacteroidales bacterium]HPY22303.1 RagB/SusD family nutrient uptake outer membrane protein [Bacteroidales bacterium]HQA93104.1 RagB/SusD family nutrient uptake outer membrane protein [Bacteroidales bacterium]